MIGGEKGIRGVDGRWADRFKTCPYEMSVKREIRDTSVGTGFEPVRHPLIHVVAERHDGPMAPMKFRACPNYEHFRS